MSTGGSSIVPFTIDQAAISRARSAAPNVEFSYEDIVRLLPPDFDPTPVSETHYVLRGWPYVDPADETSTTGGTTYACKLRICNMCTGSTACQGPTDSRPPPIGNQPTCAILIKRPAAIAALGSGQKQIAGLDGSRGPLPILAAAGSDAAALLSAYCTEQQASADLIFHVYYITDSADLPELVGQLIGIPVVVVGGDGIPPA